MMGQLSSGQERLFYSFNIEGHISANHLLRNIDRCLDLSDAGELLQRVTAFCVEIAAEYGGVIGDIQVADETFDLHWARMMSLPASIYAGANEVQLDIIARQVLLTPVA